MWADLGIKNEDMAAVRSNTLLDYRNRNVEETCCDGCARTAVTRVNHVPEALCSNPCWESAVLTEDFGGFPNLFQGNTE